MTGTGCGPGLATARGTLEPFFAAVHDREVDRLYCAMSGAASSTDLGADEPSRRAAFARWVSARYEAYDEARDAGWVDRRVERQTLVS